MQDDGCEICVLVVDDDEGVRYCLSVVLTETRYRVLTAADGVEAASILKSEPVDLLITDYVMPRMNGLDLIRWTRACLPHVGVIMITANDDPAVAAAARSCGALRVLLKPFPMEEILPLAEEIRQAMRNHGPAASSPSAHP
jgi:DNA-binding response OmpR family regulator